LTTYSVSNSAQLTSTLNLAKAGDVITLAGGSYGDVSISNNFSSDVTITSASASSPAVFRSLALNSSSHLHLDNLVVNYTPNASSDVWSSAVSVNSSSYITLTHSTITGGAAVTGVAQSASALDGSGNVLGMPTARGVLVGTSNNVVIDHVEVSKFYKGVVIASSDNVTVSHSDVHDTRTTPIVAGGGNHITIDSNHLHDVNPWHYGPGGDHGDYLAMWTNAGQAAPSTDIKITNNLMEQGAGAPVLGMWLQGGSVGYTNVQISGNAILGGHFEGLSLWDVHGAVVDHNTLLQTSGTDSGTAPIILVSTGSQNISVHDNKTAGVTDESGATGSLANAITANTIVTKWIPTAPGYYTNTLITQTEATYAPIIDGVTTAPVVVPPVVVAPPPPVVVPPTTTVGVTLQGDWNAKTLTGGAGDDTFISKNGSDTLVGGAGNDTYTILSGKTQVVEAVGGGIDTVIARGDHTLAANVENLTIATGTDNWGGAGNALDNVITGNAGGNSIKGLGGNDTLNGGAGADYISGGIGNDRLTGGTGKDTFIFEKGSGQDVITDFSKADHDVIDISAFTKAGYKPTLTDVGADLKISFSTGDTIILTGIHAKDLVGVFNGFTI
jgi:hypothetical protein